MGKKNRTVEEQIEFLKYVLFAYNLVFFLCGCAVLGVGIWVTVDGAYVSAIVGSELYAVAVYFMVIAGGLIFLISFLGCCGAVRREKCMLWTFCIILIIIFLILLITGILAGVFRTQIKEGIKDTMRSTLTDKYGVDFEHETNRRITWAWDKAQERLDCCAVETEGWAIYQESKWFAQQVWTPGNAIYRDLRCCAVENEGWELYRESEWYKKYGSDADAGTQIASEEQKPYVPQSCCMKDRFWRYINLETCQKWRLGPPGSTAPGAINRALYYQGCYEAGKTYIMKHSSILVGLGITVAFFMIVGIVCSIWLLRNMKKQEEAERNNRKNPMMEMRGLPVEDMPYAD